MKQVQPPGPKLFLAAVLVSLAAAAGAAETIGINFNNGGATLLDPTDEVGFVPSTNWNNFRNNGGLGLFNPDPTPLIDSTGAESQATISWEVGASGFNSNNGVGNQRMMEGWFGLNADDLGYIVIEDIPESLTGSTYDAYVYFDSPEIAPNEQTMTFTANGISITGKELPANFLGAFYEAKDGGVGNYVVFRDLTEPTFTLTADSDAGRAAINGLQITNEPEPEPVLPPDPNAPRHQYDAAAEGNSDTLWLDAMGNQDWTLVDAELATVTSPNTSITAAYRLFGPGPGAGGDTPPFPGGNVTYEVWVRPSDVNEDHQVIVETGGGQNGTSIMMTQDTVRLLNSIGNERGFDIEVPLDDVDTSDFVQIVAALNASAEEITLTVNGSAGGTASASQSGIIGRGGNRASLFTWGSGVGSLGASTNNLGGRTELDGMTPDGLTQFVGEIALLNVFTRAFNADDIQSAFDAVATSGPRLQAGDANMDLQFDQLDLVQVQIAAKYLTGEPATWGEGDWEGAPGGSVGNPPQGNGFFDQLDIIAALASGTYLTGPYGAQRKADTDQEGSLFKATFGSTIGAIGIGDLAVREDAEPEGRNVVGSLAGGHGVGEVELVYVPEPSTLALVWLAAIGWGLLARRR